LVKHYISKSINWLKWYSLMSKYKSYFRTDYGIVACS
jgi:hypothetical protein